MFPLFRETNLMDKFHLEFQQNVFNRSVPVHYNTNIHIEGKHK